MQQTCTNCGSQNASTQQFCTTCGTKLVRVEEVQPQSIACTKCGSQNAAGQQFCVSCGASLSVAASPQDSIAPPISMSPSESAIFPGETPRQVAATQPAPNTSPVARGAISQNYILLSAASIIFRIIGWIVLGGGVLGSIAVAVLATQGAIANLTSLLDHGLEVIGISSFTGAGVAILTFGGIIGSLLCGLFLLAFADLCNAVIIIDENTKPQE